MTNSNPVKSSRAEMAAAVIVALCLCVVPVLITVSLPSPGFKNTAPVNYGVLTSGRWNDTSPAWSPDGSLIAFTSDRSGGLAIYVITPQGAGEEQITPSGVIAANPSWSPDSSRLAYWCLDGNNASIRVLTLASNSTVALGGDAVNMTPVWSPDGTQLLFYLEAPTPRLMSASLSTLSERVVAQVNCSIFDPVWAGKDRVVYSDTEDGLYVMRWTNLTSGEAGILAQGAANYWGGAISPDGTAISYYSDWIGLVPQQPPPKGVNIWVNLLNITEFNVWTEGLSDYHAAYLYYLIAHEAKARPADVVPDEPLLWSPAGGLLACVLSSPSEGLGVYVWSLNNESQTRMGPPTAQSMEPSWDPANGTLLALSSNLSGYWHIWIAEYAPYNPAATY